MSDRPPAVIRCHTGLKNAFVNIHRSIIGWCADGFRAVIFYEKIKKIMLRIFWQTSSDMPNIVKTSDTHQLPPIYGRRGAPSGLCDWGIRWKLASDGQVTERILKMSEKWTCAPLEFNSVLNYDGEPACPKTSGFRGVPVCHRAKSVKFSPLCHRPCYFMGVVTAVFHDTYNT